MSEQFDYNVLDLPSAFGGADIHFTIKSQAADFVVTETLGFTPAGAGDHLYLYIEKTGLNTLYLRELLAQVFKVAPISIGYCGLKDKNAITRQWFSVKTPACDAEANLAELLKDRSDNASIKILQNSRGTKKLKIGAHSGNHFTIVLRDLRQASGDTIHEEQRSIVTSLLQTIETKGAPNYYGPQRFGRNTNNLAMALRLFEKEIAPSKQKRSLYISAARSYLFNAHLADRIANRSWNAYTQGDIICLCGSKSYFRIDHSQQSEIDKVNRRIQEKEVAIGAELFTAGHIENQKYAAAQTFASGLKELNLNRQVRALGVYPKEFKYHWHDSSERNAVDSVSLKLDFSLEKGAYATAILKELGHFTDQASS